MKIIFLCVGFFIFLNACQFNPASSDVTVQESVTNNIGLMTKNQLLDQFPVFESRYRQSAATREQILQLATIEQPLHLIIVFGTWCHDSQREVPKLLRLLDQTANSNISYQLVSVGENKVIPSDSNLAYRIQFTPTVILEVENKEKSRIVENPIESWSQHITSIMRQ